MPTTPVHLLPGLLAADAVSSYVPVLIMFALAAGLGLTMLVLSWTIGKKGGSNPTKDTAYECGMQPVTDAQQRFSVKFYLVALLFVIFDIEVVFFYPWAVHFQQQPLFLFVEMLVFIGILFLGWYYVIRKGAVNWAKD